MLAAGSARAHTACCRLLSAGWTWQPHAALAAWRGRRGLATGSARVQCIKPGQDPEDVVKRLDKGAPSVATEQVVCSG